MGPQGEWGGYGAQPPPLSGEWTAAEHSVCTPSLLTCWRLPCSSGSSRSSSLASGPGRARSRRRLAASGAPKTRQPAPTAASRRLWARLHSRRSHRPRRCGRPLALPIRSEQREYLYSPWV